MAEGYNKPLPKTALHEFKLRLTGPRQEGQRRPPTLQVQVVKNNPRIDVYTNVEGAKDNGKISAPMDAITFCTVLAELEKLVEGEPDVQVKISNKVGPPGKQRAISQTVIGKDPNGIVYISVISEGQARVKFPFKFSDWHEIIHKDGTPYTEAEASLAVARGWLKLMSELVPNVMDTHYIEPEPRGQGGGGGNRGGYNRGGGGGGYNRGGGSGGGNEGSSGGFDNDDFPM